MPRSALFMVKTSNKGTERLETIATLPVDIGGVSTMIVIYS